MTAVATTTENAGNGPPAPSHCRGMCRRKLPLDAVPRHRHGVDPYESGLRWCRTCRLWFRTDTTLCGCCRRRLRTKPRNRSAARAVSAIIEARLSDDMAVEPSASPVPAAVPKPPAPPSSKPARRAAYSSREFDNVATIYDILADGDFVVIHNVPTSPSHRRTIIHDGLACFAVRRAAGRTYPARNRQRYWHVPKSGRGPGGRGVRAVVRLATRLTGNPHARTCHRCIGGSSIRKPDRRAAGEHAE